MKCQFDSNFTKECFEALVNVPSPVGYALKMEPVLKQWAAICVLLSLEWAPMVPTAWSVPIWTV